MDKLVLSVIIALVVGGIAGYNIKGGISETKETETSKEPSGVKEMEKDSKETMIQDALGAAPESVVEKATVMGFPEKEGGDLIELKKGTNDWTCFPDYPASPGKDPMCVDKQGMVWMQAYMTKQSPNLTQAGLAYMLEGGSDASNTDPFATKPTEGDDWITTPAHTMLFPVGTLDPNVYGTDPKKGGPWIMWVGTPYEHLMVPVE